MKLVGIAWLGTAPKESVPNPCYWLVREVYAHDLEIALPEEGVFALDHDAMIQSEKVRWTKVETPSDYDVVLVSSGGRYHIGLYCEGGYLLHIPRGAAGAVLTPLRRYDGYIEGFYRYAP